jgi:hydroxymethylpyrimidine/phosphomethylpyrimidine kinase
MPARLLVIAGSDSSAGAGLQADLKTAEAFGVYAQTAVTAVTAQDTNGVLAVTAVSPDMVRAQIDAALDDIGADAVKIGMLADAEVAAAVVEALADIQAPLVLDPVLISTSGTPLLAGTGIGILKNRLLPRAFLITPNLPEAEILTAVPMRSLEDCDKAAERFQAMGCRRVLIKGGHGEGDTVRDVLYEAGRRILTLESPRQETRHTHGTGCALSTAIACGLAKGQAIKMAVRRAHDYVQAAIRTAPGLGRGRGPLNFRP